MTACSITLRHFLRCLSPFCFDKKCFRGDPPNVENLDLHLAHHCESTPMMRPRQDAESRPAATDNGRVKAISQILYGQYHIWDLQGVPSIGTHFRFQFLTFLIVLSKNVTLQF